MEVRSTYYVFIEKPFLHKSLIYQQMGNLYWKDKMSHYPPKQLMNTKQFCNHSNKITKQSRSMGHIHKALIGDLWHFFVHVYIVVNLNLVKVHSTMYLSLSRPYARTRGQLWDSNPWLLDSWGLALLTAPSVWTQCLNMLSNILVYINHTIQEFKNWLTISWNIVG